MYKGRTHEIDPDSPIHEQASQWCILLDGGNATRADERAFAQWVSHSPERIAAYMQAVSLTQALKSKEIRWPYTPIASLPRRAKSTSAQIVPIFSPGEMNERRQERTGRNKRWGMLLSAAAMLGIVIGTSTLLYSNQTYETNIGEQRSVVLGDGSVAILNTSSEIEVRMTHAGRMIRLLSGEAIFQVAHDPLRSFDVIAGDARVRALGTEFDVDRRPGKTTVTVVEGKVSVKNETSSENASATGSAQEAGIALSAGEQVIVAPRTRLEVTPANLAATTAWTQRRLVFDHRPLNEVVAEFNRYNRRQIEIDGADLGRQELTGAFQANDPDSLLQFVSRIPNVRIERHPDRVRVIDGR